MASQARPIPTDHQDQETQRQYIPPPPNHVLPGTDEKHTQGTSPIPWSPDAGYNAAENGNVKQPARKRKRMENRHCCIRCLCCACCLPLWAALIFWFVVIAIIIVVIVLAAIFATFKMPTIQMDGVAQNAGNSSPPITINNNTFQVDFGLIVNIDNPNLLAIDLSDIRVSADYLSDDGASPVPIGGGYLASQNVPKYSNFNFTFPFSLVYDPSADPKQTVLTSLVSKCGLSGKPKQDLSISYTIHLAAKVLFVTVHPTITSSSSFECPLDNGGGLAGLTGSSLANIG